MALTPQQAYQMLPSERQFANQLEKRIDDELALRAVDYKTSIPVSLPSEVNSRVRQEIIRRYTEAGWNVTFESDQRDGDWLRFVPQEPVP